MKVTIPLSPLSSNTAWQGRRFKTQAYKDFEQDSFIFLAGKKQIKGLVEIDFQFYLKNWKMRDVDNCLKSLIDCIVKNGLIEDDRKIMKITAQKFPAQKDSIQLEINASHTPQT